MAMGGYCVPSLLGPELSLYHRAEGAGVSPEITSTRWLWDPLQYSHLINTPPHWYLSKGQLLATAFVQIKKKKSRL